VLANEDINVYEIAGQVREIRSSQFLERRILPTNVADWPILNGNKSVTGRNVFAGGDQYLAGVAPPTSHMGLIQPIAKHGQVSPSVEWQKLNRRPAIAHLGSQVLRVSLVARLRTRRE